MYRWALGLLCAWPASMAYAQAQSAPAQLHGKSVIVSWSEDRTQRIGGEQHLRHVRVSFKLSIYISTQGRIFRRVTGNVGGRTGQREGIGQVAARGGVVATHFQGRSMSTTSTAGLAGGATRITVNFDDAFAGCSARAVFARQTGTTGPMVIERAIVGGARIEVHSVTTGSASCTVRDGNVFSAGA